MRTPAVVVGSIVGLIIALGCWVSFRKAQPEYKGRSLSYWLDAYARNESNQAAQEALRSMGTNTFPLLLEWIREPERDRHPLLMGLARVLPRPLRPKWSFPDYVDRSYLSAYALQVLGSEAAPIIPKLSAIGADPTNRDGASIALRALGFVGTNGIPALLAALRDPLHPHRDRAAFALWRSKDLGVYTNAVVSQLVALLDDPQVGQSAAGALGRLKARPDLAVLALAQCLTKTNTKPSFRQVAASSLTWFEEGAIPALPYLTNALNDPDPRVRNTVMVTLGRIHYRTQQK